MLAYETECEDTTFAQDVGLLTLETQKPRASRRHLIPWTIAAILLAWTCMLAQWTSVLLGLNMRSCDNEVSWCKSENVPE